MYSDSELEMDKICRSCLQENKSMKSIFDCLPFDGNEERVTIEYAEMMMSCASVNVNREDDYSHLLCGDCEVKLIIAYDFKLQCEKSEQRLHAEHPMKAPGSPEQDFPEPVDFQSSDEDDKTLIEIQLREQNKCSVCLKTFKTLRGLKAHEKSHVKTEIEFEEDDGDEDIIDAEEERRCTECRKKFLGFTEYNVHMKEIHRIFPCSMCEKTYTKTSHVKRHMAATHKVKGEVIQKVLHRTDIKKSMKCEFCDRTFKYKKSFVHHMRLEHGIEESPENEELLEPKIELLTENLTAAKESCEEEEMMKDNRRKHTCHVCDSIFSRSNHLTRHMTLHRALLTHKCDKCEKAFVSEEHLETHQQEDHINKPYKCTLCAMTFERAEGLLRHLKKSHEGHEGNVSCSICGKDIEKMEDLIKHVKCHLKTDKRHMCNICGKAFSRLDNLRTHQKIHTGQNFNAKLHLCVYCGKEFNNSSNMIVHIRRHTGERPYKCQECGKGFPRSHDLKCHERTHSGEKPYLCTLCGKSFNKSNKLLRHTRVHTGERPYVCNLCDRAFTQSNDLALHMRRHTGARPYACGVCPARFIQSGQLKAHRRSNNHWTETPPDLKGAYRVEPVVEIHI